MQPLLGLGFLIIDLSFFNNIKPWPNERLEKAVIIGHTTINSSKIWARVGCQGSYLLVLCQDDFLLNENAKVELNSSAILSSEKGQLTEIPFFSSFEMKFSGETDFTGVFEVNNLVPDTRYYYLLLKKEENNRFTV